MSPLTLAITAGYTVLGLVVVWTVAAVTLGVRAVLKDDLHDVLDDEGGA